MREKLQNQIVKLAAVIVMIVAICVPATVPVAAYTPTGHGIAYNGSFAKAWERYATYDNGKANLTYGFNITWREQDYCRAKHTSKSHYAALYNGSGFHTSNAKDAGKTATVTSKHSGSSVSYYIYY